MLSADQKRKQSQIYSIFFLTPLSKKCHYFYSKFEIVIEMSI